MTASNCPALTVANSDTTAFEGTASDTRLVTCSDGYSSLLGSTFTTNCDGTAWSSLLASQLTCDGIEYLLHAVHRYIS